MRSYVLRRLGQALIVLVGVSIAAFSIIHLVDGDPVRLALGTRFDQETYNALRSRAGPDHPLVVQYFDWSSSAATGDLGVSFRRGRSVNSLIVARDRKSTRLNP